MDIFKFLELLNRQENSGDILTGIKKAIYLLSIYEDEGMSNIYSPSDLIFRNAIYDVAFGFKIISSELIDKYMLNSDMYAASLIEDMYEQVEDISLQSWLDYLYDAFGEEFIEFECGQYFKLEPPNS